MKILNLNNDLAFELPYTDGGFDEYVRGIVVTDNERDLVLSLMKGEYQAELEDLGLDLSHPELFAKLKDIYDKMDLEAAEMHWLWSGFREGAFEYDIYEVMDHCEANCGFTFEADSDEYDDEEDYDISKVEAFEEWLEDYLIGLDEDEFKDFMYEHLNAHVDLD